jgi:hypothetical protein
MILKCAKCKQNKDETEFPKSSYEKWRNGRHSYCFICSRENSKQNYLNNKELYKFRTNRAKKKRIKKKSEIYR